MNRPKKSWGYISWYNIYRNLLVKGTKEHRRYNIPKELLSYRWVFIL